MRRGADGTSALMSTGRTIEDVAGGLPRHYVRSCVLLLTAEEPAHGYDLLDKLAELGAPGADPGGLYRILRSMEQEGLLESAWETSSSGPARRTYSVTDEGREWLHAWAGAHNETIRILRGFLDRYSWLDSAQRTRQG